jgi:hypothetical protein
LLGNLEDSYRAILKPPPTDHPAII